MTDEAGQPDLSPTLPTRRSETSPALPAGDWSGLAEDFPHHRRYDVRNVLGAGGQGVVFRVRDKDLGRDVALKTLRTAETSPHATQRFQREAEATALLEHPNIVPIYDVGQLADGRPYYTMRLVAGRTLGEVLSHVREEADAGRDDPEWSLMRLLRILQQACLALDFAHERGVVHRDVKPGNILLGEFGEVLLVDWGISRAWHPGRAPTTGSGAVQGTLHYMSPEQARGEDIDSRTDVYAMGVVLYQCLALDLPFNAPSGAELIAAILRDPPPRPEQRTQRPVPPELSALTLHALAKDRTERVPSARALHDGLQDFIEGARDRARRMAAAESFKAEGLAAMHASEQAAAEATALREEVERLAQGHPPWLPVSAKRPLIEARARLENLEEAARQCFLDAVRHFTEALAVVPEHAEVRRVLADAFLGRFRQAEIDGDRAMAQVYRSLVERFHDGRHAHVLDGVGSLALAIEPPGAEATLHRLVERDLVLTEDDGTNLPTAGSEPIALSMGSYVVVARAPGARTTRYPVAIFRNTTWTGTLALPPRAQVPPAFVHVPAAEAWLGGDARATNAWPLRRARVASFLMGLHPVTFGEWAEFLDAQVDAGSMSEELVPRLGTDGVLCGRDSESGRYIPLLGRDTAAERERWGADCVSRMPVIGIDMKAIEAFLAWAGARDGRTYRLPTAEEWELAARGVDRRLHPWGNAFDASLCHIRESLAGRPTLGPVGAFPSDVSVYGVRDMAGCIQERTSSAFGPGGGVLEVRGGCWMSGAVTARCCWRGGAEPGARAELLGFRLAADMPQGIGHGQGSGAAGGS